MGNLFIKCTGCKSKFDVFRFTNNSFFNSNFLIIGRSETALDEEQLTMNFWRSLAVIVGRVRRLRKREWEKS